MAGKKACTLTEISRKQSQEPSQDSVCHYEFKPGSKVELTAVPVAKNRFVKWLGSAVTKPSFKLTAKHKNDKELTAVFAKTPTIKR